MNILVYVCSMEVAPHWYLNKNLRCQLSHKQKAQLIGLILMSNNHNFIHMTIMKWGILFFNYFHSPIPHLPQFAKHIYLFLKICSGGIGRLRDDLTCFILQLFLFLLFHCFWKMEDREIGGWFHFTTILSWSHFYLYSEEEECEFYGIETSEKESIEDLGNGYEYFSFV